MFDKKIKKDDLKLMEIRSYMGTELDYLCWMFVGYVIVEKDEETVEDIFSNEKYNKVPMKKGNSDADEMTTGAFYAFDCGYDCLFKQRLKEEDTIKNLKKKAILSGLDFISLTVEKEKIYSKK